MAMSNLLASMILLLAPAVTLCGLVTGKKLVDLSHAYDQTTLNWVQDRPFQMIISENGTTEDGVWMQREEITLGTHTGTHIDAPCHMSKGSWTLDQIPLNHFIAPAAVVDITNRANTDANALLQVSDLERWEHQSGRSLDGTVVLMRTGWSSRWPDREAYMGTAENDVNRLRFPGVSGEAARWLVHNRRIYGIGTDSLSLDSGANIVRRVPAHQVILGGNIYALENLANLHMLPEHGAQVHVSPIRLGGGACGGPARIIAVVP